MNQQFGRKASLLVSRPEFRGNNPSAFVAGSTLDLSAMHFTFQVVQEDVESPNNCTVRIFNLSEQTRDAILKESYTRIVLQAGYQDGSFGVIFDGTIKQFRVGKVGALDSYLDLLAADGDLAYNFSVIKKTLASGSSPADVFGAVVEAMGPLGVRQGYAMDFTGGVLPRGKVLFGMGRSFMRNLADSQKATWSIQNGKLQVIPLDSYKPGEVVVLNAATGLIGRPEQTEEGLRVRCLLNPRIQLGGLVRIDNRAVNRTINSSANPYNLAFNQWAGLQQLATVTTDGIYRVYVAEYTGDTRGQDWYTDLICLAVGADTKKVAPYG